MEKLLDMEGLVLNHVEIPVEIQDMEISWIKEISWIWKQTSHTVHSKTIGLRK